MKPLSDQEFTQTETLLRQRLGDLATHAPTEVHLPGEVPVMSVAQPGRRGRRAGMLAAIAALVGAGGFTTYSFIGASNDGGATTPQEAVQSFVSALENEDVLGMIDVTLPQEVGVLRDATDSVISDGQRIGVLDDEFDEGAIRGIDITVEDLVLETNFLEGGLAAVSATSGSVGASFDPARFPLGDAARLLLSGSLEGETAVSDLAGINPNAVLMTVEQNGRWYVSVEYTIAEYIRRAAGWEVPGPVSRTPVGFESPEAAATGFYERLAALDLQSSMDTFAPGEDAIAWLAQAWMADAVAATDRARADGWSVGISGLTYETIGDGAQRTLRPLTFTVQGTTPPGFNGESSDAESTDPQPFTVERADGCTTITGAAGESMFGSETPPWATAVEGGYRLCSADNEILGGITMLVTGSGLELPAVSVVEADGKWYISPLGTVLSSATLGLHDVVDGSSLFDSVLAPFLYGGLGRTTLESMVIGQEADAIDAECLAALTVEDGVVTGVVPDPSPASTRACAATGYFPDMVSESGSSTAPPVVVEVAPASSMP